MLILAFFLVFAFFLLDMHAEYFTILYVMIYLGAVMTLLLFAIMIAHAMTRPEHRNQSLFSETKVEFEKMLNIFFAFCKLFINVIYYIWQRLLNKKEKLDSIRQNIDVSIMKLVELYNADTKLGLLLVFGVKLFYFILFLLFVYWTQTYSAVRLYGIYSENVFYYLGPIIDFVSQRMYTDFQYELILVGICFWLAFICVVILLYKRKNKK